MNWTLWLFAAVIAVALAYYLAEPLTKLASSAPQDAENDPGQETKGLRAAVLRDLAELEFDFAGGKFPPAEYDQRKKALLQRLASAEQAEPEADAQSPR